ncbi:MAG: helix-turn-helix domain-containing protein [Egibacteraceae bacterium]
MMGHGLSIGDRVRYHRKRRSLSQTVLANRVGRSESWLSQVERGNRPIVKLNDLIALGEVLRVDLVELTGQPYRLIPDGGGEHPVVAPLRAALLTYDAFGISDDVPPPSVGDLTAKVERTQRMWYTVRRPFSAVAPSLPELLVDAQAAVRATSGDEQRRAWAAACHTYHLMRVVLKRLGEFDLGMLAGDRAMLAAQYAEDPLLVALSAFRLSHVLCAAGHPQQAHDLAMDATALLDPLDRADRGHTSMRGALELAAAWAATCRHDDATAWRRLRVASDAADRLGGDDTILWVIFGPTNVAIHGVVICAELGEPAEALRRAEHVEVAPVPTQERRFSFFIGLARAHSQLREDYATLWALLKAERNSPEDLRYHPFAREMIRDLLRRDRRTIREELHGLADRAGVR